MGETIETIFVGIWEVWKEMASMVWSVIPIVFYFTLWILSGIIILPCVFIAGHIYPAWMKWGEDF